jgi:hypothetical protein
MIEIDVEEETIVVLRYCSQEALDSLGTLDVLKVNGGLFLYSCTGLTELPDDLKVNGSLNLYNSEELTRLPDGLRVAGRLDLRYCAGITMLPEDLNVDGGIWYNSETGFFDRKDEPGVIPDHLKNKLMKF